MYELELKNLLALAATANSVDSCESYMRRLNTLKGTIQRTAGMGLEAITGVNSIDRMLGILDRRADSFDAEDEFRKRDQLRDQKEKKDDGFQVKPVQDEVIARGSYRK